MANIVKKIHLVKSDPAKNNHKWWDATLYDNGDVLCEWARIGDDPQTLLKQGVGEDWMMRKVAEKKRAGRNGEIPYREHTGILDGVTVAAPSVKPTADLRSLALKQIKTSAKNAEIEALIKYMTDVNIHNITTISGNRIQYNVDKGLFQTALGLVDQNTIDTARSTLEQIAECVAQRDYGDTLLGLTRDYCMTIPQDIGRHRLDLHDFWSDMSKVQQHNSILDGLQASLVQATKPSKKGKANEPAEEQVFNVNLDVENDDKVRQEIFNYYLKTRSTMHTCYDYEPIKLWRVTIATQQEAFDNDGAKMPCIVKGWHGTSAENLLSLLKSGFLVRPPASTHLTCQLFGAGVYCAPLHRETGRLVIGSGTKALNYATGFWGGRNTSRTFMFFVNMAMGKYYTPTAAEYRNIDYPVRGYDSTWAFGGHSGVKNDEAIVYRSSQVNIKYLVEFAR